jgi:hypothetical protein
MKSSTKMPMGKYDIADGRHEAGGANLREVQGGDPC